MIAPDYVGYVSEKGTGRYSKITIIKMGFVL